MIVIATEEAVLLRKEGDAVRQGAAREQLP
jgi:hypothetical protein